MLHFRDSNSYVHGYNTKSDEFCALSTIELLLHTRSSWAADWTDYGLVIVRATSCSVILWTDGDGDERWSFCPRSSAAIVLYLGFTFWISSELRTAGWERRKDARLIFFSNRHVYRLILQTGRYPLLGVTRWRVLHYSLVPGPGCRVPEPAQLSGDTRAHTGDIPGKTINSLWYYFLKISE